MRGCAENWTVGEQGKMIEFCKFENPTRFNLCVSVLAESMENCIGACA